MTPKEAREALRFHACQDEDYDDPRWQNGFVGSLRPFQGLRKENFLEVVECMRVLAPEIISGADRELSASLWAIVFASVCWGIAPDGTLQRNQLITPDEVRRLAKWTNHISLSTLLLIDGGDINGAFAGWELWDTEP